MFDGPNGSGYANIKRYSAAYMGGGTLVWGHDTFRGVKFAWNDPVIIMVECICMHTSMNLHGVQNINLLNDSKMCPNCCEQLVMITIDFRGP